MAMKREEMMTIVQAEMPEKRWRHTLGVMKTAMRLASKFGGNKEKAETAAILHDYCKYWPIARQGDAIRQEGAWLDVLDYDKELWHAHAAAIMAPATFGVSDPEVLDAIRFHTSGRASMTKLDKIVCLADYMEPGRDFPGVDLIRELAENSLEAALLAGFDSTISFLLSNKKRIYPLTVISRNRLIEELAETAGG